MVCGSLSAVGASWLVLCSHITDTPKSGFLEEGGPFVILRMCEDCEGGHGEEDTWGLLLTRPHFYLVMMWSLRVQLLAYV